LGTRVSVKISVIIPTYNRYEVLKRALSSVFAQTHLPFEAIVIDDGSTDSTREIQKDYPSVKYFYQENSGVSSARNLGIKKANCEWIAFLDSDDEWDVNKLQEQALFYKNNTDIFMSYTAEKWIRNAVEVKVPKKFRKIGGVIFEECLSHCIIAPSSTLIHKNILNAVGLFDESLEVCEDYDLWLRVSRMYEIGLVDKFLTIKYGGEDDQLSIKYWGMDRFRVVALENLLKTSDDKRDLIVDTLVKKYRVLLKGAIKHNRMSDANNYKMKLEFYEDSET